MKVSNLGKIAWLFKGTDWLPGAVIGAVSISMILVAIGFMRSMASGDGPRNCSVSCGQYGKSLKSFSREGNNVKCECGEAVK